MDYMMKRIIIISALLTGLSLVALGTQLETENQPAEAATMNQTVNVKAVSSAISSFTDVKLTKVDAIPKKVATSSENNEVKANSQPSEAQEKATDTAQVTSVSSETATAEGSKTAATVNETQPTQVVAESNQSTQNTTAVTETPVVSSDIQWLIQHESGGNVNAQNGAYYGIGQLSENYYAQYVPGKDYHGNYAVQLEAMQKYISARYGTVANAIAHWQVNNWY
ncbi:aggregation-promoting factor C-terminal-like domain-containing protein [Leuconostoc suionicum]|uniref:aggregation-promoting factor C-terminal-like domain-containing protein n=1 Tax=Leuconostoc suionicum TaxID=1511761 RepID=UPI0028895F76|nr:peptidoglycan-binding protein [Leuconostoc suionicum]MCT4375791.1 peptidoglycan-binding protein [Leuconostoc suionicum]